MTTVAARYAGNQAAAPKQDPVSFLFEGLFVKGLPAEPAFREELRRLGYDPEVAGDRSPRLFSDCLEVARRHFFPSQPKEEGLRQLGRRLVEGFMQTTKGKLAGAALPFLGPNRALGRLPTPLSIGGLALRVMPTQLGQRCWRLEFRNEPHLRAEFAAGAAEEALRRMRVHPAVSIQRTAEPGGFDLNLCW